MNELQPTHSFSREQKIGFIFMLIFAILTVSLGALQLRNTIYGPFVIKLAGRTGLDTLLSDEDARLAAIDTDQDGINDYNEIKLYETSAYLPDTDSDGIGDKQEIEAGTDPLCPEGADCAAESELPPGATSSPFVSPLQSSVITPGDILGTGSAPSAAASTSFDITSLVDNPADLRALILASGKIDPQELDKIDDATLVKLAKDLLNQSQTGSSPQ
ncbi:MAG: Fibronectin type III domain protein [Candidatus Magasanikbacteria bacterium GW2011_GWA2_56_11]|uniref:Fibronectin type III domain protein n=1 Tax=Candidatus Magasanikbacteria bacterium GW2011_GWA2_56_11 TaxID=1619044 RepID=A0A0G1YFV4_9BACT|nr:MAG: Fibronectin type III domain protein [Candidatus Magasanikbacteria bacterium GW2011_GWA2_56_11]